MRPVSTTSVLAAAALLACAEAPAPLQISVAVPFPIADAQTNCDFAGMTATLWVAGNHPACPLQVDATTAAVSGSCTEIRTGREWPLLIVYALPAIPPVGATLGYLVGTVDLRPDSLPDGDSPTVSVSLEPEGSWAADETTFATWAPATGCASYQEQGATPTAREWAYCFVTDPDGKLDTLLACEDGVAPLVKACTGTLTTCARPTTP